SLHRLQFITYMDLQCKSMYVVKVLIVSTVAWEMRSQVEASLRDANLHLSTLNPQPIYLP
ncbi:MAG: hypothetical protein ABL921_32380, partial [Pirellula sp.]